MRGTFRPANPPTILICIKMAPTHRVTIERRTDSGDWVTVVEKVPGRHHPEGAGLVREATGSRVRDAPGVTIHAQYVGEIDDDTGEYSLAVGAGDNWRVTIHGLRDEPRRKSIINVIESYGHGRVPDTIHFETEVIS